MEDSRKLRATPRRRVRSAGFTLVEMLVVIAIIAILAGILLPTLAKAKQRGRAVECLNNSRQLILGWKMYSDEHDDLLLASAAVPGMKNWMTGWLDFTAFSDGESHILDSPLYAYVKSTKVFKCPEDRSGRPRSMAMNSWMGGPAFGPSGPGWRVYVRQDTIDKPSDRFVFVDEREDSINDGKFVVNMKDHPSGASQRIVSYPGSYHNQAANFTFADGHAAPRRWEDSRTDPALVPGKLLPSNIPSPDNPDVTWLQNQSTSRRP